MNTPPAQQTLKRNTFFIITVAFASFFTLGFTNGAFAVAWGSIEADLGLLLSHSGLIIMVNQVAYALSSSLVGRLYKYAWLEHIDFWGIFVMGAGLFGVAISPNFELLLLSVMVLGIGSGLIDSSISTYMTQFFSASHFNWMYVFWGVGSTVGPLLMAFMIGVNGWRAGYMALMSITAVVSTLVVVSFMTRAWDSTKDIERVKLAVENRARRNELKKRFLSKKRHQVGSVLTCFLSGGLDYTLIFFTAKLMAIRTGPEAATLFTTVYYFAMLLGNLVFGWVARYKNNLFLIRSGLIITMSGIVVLLLTNHVAGIALAGFGVGPVFPSLIHDTSNRYAPKILSRLVSYEVAAFGAGMAIGVYLLSHILPVIGLGYIFVICLTIAAAMFVNNEWLERERKRAKAVNITLEP